MIAKLLAVESKTVISKSIIGNYQHFADVSGPNIAAAARPGGVYYDGQTYHSLWRGTNQSGFYNAEYFTTENLKDFTAYAQNPVFDITGNGVRRCFPGTFFVDGDLIYMYYVYPDGDGKSSMCLSTSSNWIDWSDLGIVIESQIDEPGGVYAACCIKDRGTLYVFAQVANQFEQVGALYDIKCYSSATPTDVNSYTSHGIIIPRLSNVAGEHLSSVRPFAINKRGAFYEMLVGDIDNRNKIYGFRSTSLLSGYIEVCMVFQDFLTNENDYVKFNEELVQTAVFYDPISEKWHMYYSLRKESAGINDVRISVL